MNVWVDWWQGRALRAELVGDRMGEHLENLLDSWGPSIAEWVVGQETLSEWRKVRSSRHVGGGSGFWSERAQGAEQVVDMLARVLQAIDEHHNLSYSWWGPLRRLLDDYRGGRELRYGALPAGHTLAGHLTSGGIDV